MSGPCPGNLKSQGATCTPDADIPCTHCFALILCCGVKPHTEIKHTLWVGNVAQANPTHSFQSLPSPIPQIPLTMLAMPHQFPRPLSSITVAFVLPVASNSIVAHVKPFCTLQLILKQNARRKIIHHDTWNTPLLPACMRPSACQSAP